MRRWLQVVIQLVAVLVAGFVGGQGVQAANWNTPLTLVLGIAGAALALVVYAWVVRWTERRAPAEVALKGAVGAVGRGLAIGAGAFTFVIVNIAFLEGYRAAGVGSVAGAIALFGFTAAAAVTEELMLRAFLFRWVEKLIGTWWALLLTAVIFGFLHLMNPHAGLWSAIAIAIAGGGMLAAAYAATRNLWVPIGLHFGWNYAEGGIFGTDISGVSAPKGLVDGVLSGPSLLTGGEFGPEASLYTVFTGAVVTCALMWLARRRGHIVAPLWRTARVRETVTLTG